MGRGPDGLHRIRDARPAKGDGMNLHTASTVAKSESLRQKLRFDTTLLVLMGPITQLRATWAKSARRGPESTEPQRGRRCERLLGRGCSGRMCSLHAQ